MDIDLSIGGTMGGAGSESIKLDPLCGSGSCVPDDGRACADEGGMGGAGGANGSALGGQAGGVNYDPGDLADVGASCQVSRAADCEGSLCPIERTCAPSGASSIDEPCVSSSDCRPG
jgi:hypothetical protein